MSYTGSGEYEIRIYYTLISPYLNGARNVEVIGLGKGAKSNSWWSRFACLGIGWVSFADL